MTPFSVFPLKTMRFQMSPFSNLSTLNSVFKCLRFRSFSMETPTQKRRHSTPFSYENGVMDRVARWLKWSAAKTLAVRGQIRPNKVVAFSAKSDQMNCSNSQISANFLKQFFAIIVQIACNDIFHWANQIQS